MNNFLKNTAIILLATGITVSTAALSMAAQSGGNGGNNGGNNSGGRGASGIGGASSDGGIGADDPFQKDHKRIRYIIIDNPNNPNDPDYPRRPKRPKRPSVNVVQETNLTCEPLFTIINRSNMMKTVPAYQECLRKFGN